MRPLVPAVSMQLPAAVSLRAFLEEPSGRLAAAFSRVHRAALPVLLTVVCQCQQVQSLVSGQLDSLPERPLHLVPGSLLKVPVAAASGLSAIAAADLVVGRLI